MASDGRVRRRSATAPRRGVDSRRRLPAQPPPHSPRRHSAWAARCLTPSPPRPVIRTPHHPAGRARCLRLQPSNFGTGGGQVMLSGLKRPRSSEQVGAAIRARQSAARHSLMDRRWSFRATSWLCSSVETRLPRERRSTRPRLGPVNPSATTGSSRSILRNQAAINALVPSTGRLQRVNSLHSAI